MVSRNYFYLIKAICLHTVCKELVVTFCKQIWLQVNYINTNTQLGIGLRVNAHKTEYMCFNQTGDISTLGSSSLKLVDKFTNLGSSVSSTKKDIDTRLTKSWTAIDRLSVIWKT